MDTSQEYIKMCEQTEEVQSVKMKSFNGVKHYAAGDIFSLHEKIYILGGDKTGLSDKETVWLPRQDQLIELLQPLTEGYKYKIARLADIIQYQTNGARSYFDTFEKILLTIYMEKIHMKWWDTDNNKWINI